MNLSSVVWQTPRCVVTACGNKLMKKKFQDYFKIIHSSVCGGALIIIIIFFC